MKLLDCHLGLGEIGGAIGVALMAYPDVAPPLRHDNENGPGVETDFLALVILVLNIEVKAFLKKVPRHYPLGVFHLVRAYADYPREVPFIQALGDSLLKEHQLGDKAYIGRSHPPHLLYPVESLLVAHSELVDQISHH